MHARPVACTSFQNDSGLRGNNGLSGLQNLPGPGCNPAIQAVISIWFLLGLCRRPLGGAYLLWPPGWCRASSARSFVRSAMTRPVCGSLAISVEAYKLFIFTFICRDRRRLRERSIIRKPGIVNPAELAPIASIYLAVWVAIGGRGRLYGAVIGAAFVSLLSTWFTGGQAPDIQPGMAIRIQWVNWWTVLAWVCHLSAVTLFAPTRYWWAVRSPCGKACGKPDRHGKPILAPMPGVTPGDRRRMT